jgi:hypothetical protein
VALVSALGRTVLALAAVLLLASTPPAGATLPSDPDVERGIKLVEDGDYDGAIFLLDATARRLAQDPRRAQDLSQAYLHLGIAYLAKGHESAAKAQFREALARIHDLSLSSERFSPKVIDLFEAAKAELRRAPASAAAVPAVAAPRRGGGGKGLLLVGGGVAAAAGVALAAAGGSGGTADPGTPGATTPPGPQSRTFSGTVAGTENLSFPFTAGTSGTLEAKLTWENAETLLALDLHVPGSVVATSTRTSRTTANLTVAVGPHGYTLQLLHRGGCAEGPPNPHCSTPFTLQVTHP